MLCFIRLSLLFQIFLFPMDILWIHCIHDNSSCPWSGDLAEARQVLEALEKTLPGLAVVRLRRAALERRAGQLERSEALLEEAVGQSREKPTLHAFYSIKLARLLLKLGRNPSRARTVLQEALEISPVSGGTSSDHTSALSLSS